MRFLEGNSAKVNLSEVVMWYPLY